MRSRLFLSFVFITLSSLGSAHALESDQYMTIGREMPDLLPALNEHLNNTIEEVLEENAQKDLSCDDLRKKSLKHLSNAKFGSPLVKEVEHWLENHYGDAIYPPADRSNNSYFKESIYNFGLSFIMRWVPMGRNLNAGGIYFGADKLAHFFSTGSRYYSKYKSLKKKQNRKGLSEDDIHRKLVDYGILMENTYLGKWVSGVYSYGDLEANYQGFLLNRNFCNGDNAYLQKSEQDGKYHLVRRVDLGDYFNPMFDETFNRSHYTKLKWLKVGPEIKKKVCPKLETIRNAPRYAYYQTALSPSFSVRYIEELKAKGSRRTPDTTSQAPEVFCR